MLQTLKRTLCILLAVLLIISVAAVGVSAAEKDDLIVGTVKVGGDFSKDYPEQTYYYSDEYFRTSGKKLNEHLASLSALSAFYIENPTESSSPEDYTEFFRQLGFDDFAFGDLDVMTADSFGTLICRKTVDGVPVIAVTTRSDYRNEWASNLLAGTEGDLTGFSAAAKKLEDRIRDYLQTRGIKKAKYWISGYSRGGAVANLVGATLNENLESFATTADDIYVYTYESPLCTPDPVAYENIHNYIDENDLVVKVFPEVWSMGRHGVEIPIGDTNATIMTKSFTLLEPYAYDFAEVDRSEFLDEFVTFFGTGIDRQTYAEQLEQPLSELVDIAFSLSEDDLSKLKTFAEVVGENVKNDPALLVALLSFISDPTSEESVKGVNDLLMRSIDAAVESEGKPIDDQAFEKIVAAIPNLIKVLAPVIIADGSHEFEDGSSATFYYLTSFISNAGDIITYHFNTSLFELIKPLDSYYSENAEILGDVDGDIAVTVLDVTCLQRSLNDLYELDEAAQKRADADSDGIVTVIDATMLQRFKAGLAAPKGIGKLL